MKEENKNILNKQESKENITKLKIQEYFSKNKFLTKNNFQSFIEFIGLGEIWSTEADQNILWDTIISYSNDKENVEHEAALKGISDFFNEEDSVNEDKSNGSETDISLNLQNSKSKLDNEDNVEKSFENHNCIDEFINSLNDDIEKFYGIKFINEIYFNDYLNNNNLSFNKNEIINEIKNKYKFIKLSEELLKKYFNQIALNNNSLYDTEINISLIKYINVILSKKNF